MLLIRTIFCIRILNMMVLILVSVQLLVLMEQEKVR